MNDQDLMDKHDANWELMPVELRERAIRQLLSVLSPEVQEQLKAMYEKNPFTWWTEDMVSEEKKKTMEKQYGFYVPAPFHFHMGMAIRNALRQEIKDEELPEVEYEGGHRYRNWDDFYIPVIEATIGVRSVY